MLVVSPPTAWLRTEHVWASLRVALCGCRPWGSFRKGDGGLMENPAVDSLVGELLAREQRLRGPLPYADCRNLLARAGEGYEGFGPDLATYFSDIASHCGGVKRILGWPDSELA